MVLALRSSVLVRELLYLAEMPRVDVRVCGIKSVCILKLRSGVDVLTASLWSPPSPLPPHTVATFVFTEKLGVPRQNHLCIPAGWGFSVLQMSDYNTNRPICF